MMGLAALLCLGTAMPGAEAGKKKSRVTRKAKRRLNMPEGWTWPPSVQMRRDGKQCLAHLGELGVKWKKGKATRKVATPVVVPDMTFGQIKLVPTFRKGPFVMDCHLAEALAMHSQVFHDLGVRELRFSSIHSYRNVRRKGFHGRALSRHALGLAVDVYEFVLDDGQKLVVEDDYEGGDGLLPEVEGAINQTGAFRILLTPGSDPRSHYDHFHFEARMPQPRTRDPGTQASHTRRGR